MFCGVKGSVSTKAGILTSWLLKALAVNGVDHPDELETR